MAEKIAISLDRLFADTDLQQALDNGRAAFAKEAGLIDNFSWPVLRKSMEEALRGETHFDLLDWLAQGWNIAREIYELKDSPAASPGVAKFGKRKVNGAIHPIVSFSIAGAPPTELKLTVDIAAEFSAVTVKVAEAHILECGCGTCALTVQLKYQTTPLCEPQKLNPIELPLQHRFETPIPIP